MYISEEPLDGDFTKCDPESSSGIKEDTSEVDGDGDEEVD